MAGTKKLSAVDFSSLKGINLGTPTGDTDASTKLYVDDAKEFAISRTNHTGSVTVAESGISDFDTAVRAGSSVSQLTAPAAPLAMNSQKITGLADPANPQEAATKKYVDDQLSAQASGLVLKGSVRAATDTSITITAPGTTIDGLTPANNEVFWLRAQTTTGQNGPWVYKGAAVAMTRPTNFAVTADLTLGSFWDVREGTYADTFILMTNDSAVTMSSGVTTPALTSVIRGGSSGATGFTSTLPAISAGATFDVTHGLNTKFIVVQVARVASPYDFVDVRIERKSTTQVTVLPDVSISNGEYEIMVQKVA